MSPRPAPNPAEPQPDRFGSPLGRYFAATRPAFLSVTLVACLIGLASAWRSGIAPDAATAIVTVLFALVAHAAGNVINDYHDAVSGADDANTGRLFPFTGGSRFIQNGVLGLRQTGVFGYGLLATVVPAGLWLSWQAGPGLVLIGLAGLVLGWAYSAPPLKLVSRGLGELAIAACWLLVVVGTDYVQRGAFDALPFVAGLSYALLVANLLFINQFPDHAGDAAAGKRTLVVRLGAARAAHGLPLLGLCAAGWHLGLMAAGAIPFATGAALLPLLALVPASAQLKRHASDPARLRPAITGTLAATVGYGAVLTLTLWIDA